MKWMVFVKIRWYDPVEWGKRVLCPCSLIVRCLSKYVDGKMAIDNTVIGIDSAWIFTCLYLSVLLLLVASNDTSSITYDQQVWTGRAVGDSFIDRSVAVLMQSMYVCTYVPHTFDGDWWQSEGDLTILKKLEVMHANARTTPLRLFE